MISVIVFTKNSEAVLVRVLAPLVKAVFEGHLKEVIIWDSGSADSTYEIADDTGCLFYHSIQDIDSQQKDYDLSIPDPREAIAKARGGWFLLLTDKSFLTELWLDASLSHIHKHHTRAGYFPLKLAPKRPDRLILQWLLSVKLLIFGEPLDIQALLISRPLYETLSEAEFQYHIEKNGQFCLKKVLGKRRIKVIPGSHIHTDMLTFQALFPLNGFLIRVWARFRTLLGFPPKPPKM